MNAQQKKTLAARAEIFKALGHPARLAMVSSLGKREHCVCELQEIVGLDMSTVSNHLSVLRAAGLVESDKRGKQVFYSLRLRCTAGFIECVDRAIAEGRGC
jgi:ArsR family transcriptional regulator